MCASPMLNTHTVKLLKVVFHRYLAAKPELNPLEFINLSQYSHKSVAYNYYLVIFHCVCMSVTILCEHVKMSKRAQ